MYNTIFFPQIIATPIFRQAANLIIAVMLIGFAGCSTLETSDENSNYAGNNGIANENSTENDVMKAIDSMLYADGNFSPEVGAALKGMMQQSIDNPDAFWADMEEKANNVLYITPNPTSSSVTVEFFRGQPANKIQFPELALDLYFENHKIRTINYANVSASVVIPETYLQQAGTYTVVVDFFQTGYPLSRSFVVIKK
jgi:hypothetical protein